MLIGQYSIPAVKYMTYLHPLYNMKPSTVYLSMQHSERKLLLYIFQWKDDTSCMFKENLHL